VRVGREMTTRYFSRSGGPGADCTTNALGHVKLVFLHLILSAGASRA
jgi:hypothetical protein